MRTSAPATHEIISYLHCRKCMDELPEGVSPRDYARYEFGYTQWGMQVWCLRHDCNIIHVDYENHKFYANIKATDDEETTVH